MSQHSHVLMFTLLLLASCTTQTAPMPMGDAKVVELFQQLHAPIYQVYGLGTDRDAIHDHLSASFEGEALTQQYIEHFSTQMRMQHEQTAIAVKRVDYETVTVLSRSGRTVRVDVDWSVGGVVTHQRHKHPRVNRYQAIYTLVLTEQGLRISNTRMRNLERVRGLLSSSSEALLPEDMPTSGSGFLTPLDLLEAGILDEVTDE